MPAARHAVVAIVVASVHWTAAVLTWGRSALYTWHAPAAIAMHKILSSRHHLLTAQNRLMLSFPLDRPGTMHLTAVPGSPRAFRPCIRVFSGDSAVCASVAAAAAAASDSAASGEGKRVPSGDDELKCSPESVFDPRGVGVFATPQSCDSLV